MRRWLWPFLPAAPMETPMETSKEPRVAAVLHAGQPAAGLMQQGPHNNQQQTPLIEQGEQYQQQHVRAGQGPAASRGAATGQSRQGGQRQLPGPAGSSFPQGQIRYGQQQQQQFRSSTDTIFLSQAPRRAQGIPLAFSNQPAAYTVTPQLHTSAAVQHVGWGGQYTGLAVQAAPGFGQRLAQRSPAGPASSEIIASLVQPLSNPAANATSDHVANALSQLDSRQCASFLRECSHRGGLLLARAWEVFNWLRSLQHTSPYAHLRGLLDVFTYTAMISMCAGSKEANLAFDLSREMEQRAIPLNVHTYSALMNVAVKASRPQLALDTFQRMQQAGCTPNLVTYNTLIDVYGKLGLWADAIQVLPYMRERGVEPAVRTYNTLMIACTLSNRWQEALQVYQRMREAGLRPNTTTYNALISAYSKVYQQRFRALVHVNDWLQSGQLDNVMAVFAEMVEAGCERSVITYSTLIAACERVGRWETALQLFARMPADGCQPNTITYNSLIAACAQGMQWQIAMQLFDQMVTEGHRPDVVSYTALISACGKGCQWRRALQAFFNMKGSGCQPDHIIYETIIEALWDTGVKLPQLRAVQMYIEGLRKGLLRHIDPLQQSASASSSGSTAGIEPTEITITSGNTAMLMLGYLMLLQESREKVLMSGSNAVPATLVVRMGGKGRVRDPVMFSNLATAVRGWLRVNRCPMQLTSDSYSGSIRLAATSAQLATWSTSTSAEAALSLLLLPGASGATAFSEQSPAAKLEIQETGFQQEEAHYAGKEAWCLQAYQIIHQFENSHRLSVAAMSTVYLDTRQDLLDKLAQVCAQLQVPTEQLYDALLLLDRAMGGGTKHLPADQLPTASLAALLIVSKQAPPGPPILTGLSSGAGQMGVGSAAVGAPRLGTGAAQVVSADQLARAMGIPVQRLLAMQSTLRTALAQGTAAISAVHSLRMYHFFLGYSTGGIPQPDKMVVGSTPAASASVESGQLQQGAEFVEGSSAAVAEGAATDAVATGSSTARSQQPRFGDFPEAAEAGMPNIGGLSLSESQSTGRASTSQSMSGPPGSRPLTGPSAATATQGGQQHMGLTPAAVGNSPVRGAAATTAAAGATSASVSLTSDDAELCSYQLVHLAIGSKEFLNLRPSVVAAAALYSARLLHGQVPLWPTALVQLTGGLDVGDPEMAMAISLMQRFAA